MKNEIERIKNYLKDDPARLRDFETILKVYGADEKKTAKYVKNFIKNIALDALPDFPLKDGVLGLAEDLINNNRKERLFSNKKTCETCQGHGTLTYSYWICELCKFENSMGVGLPNSPVNFSPICVSCKGDNSQLGIRPWDRGIICHGCNGNGFIEIK